MPPETGGLLLVHAHPDDEAFGTGGTIARAVAEGHRVDLVTCTGGEEGEIHDPTLDETEAQPRLREIRAAELDCAVDALRGSGPGELALHRLGYRDSGMMGTESNDRDDVFWRADLDEATGRLVEIVRRVRPAAILSYDANGNYGHPDHINAHRIAAAAWEAAPDAARHPSAGEPWTVSRFYEIAFNRDRWFALMVKMRQRGIKLPWDMDEAMERVLDQAAGAAAADAPAAGTPLSADSLNPSNAEAARQVDEALSSGEEPESFGVAEADLTTIVDVSAYRAQKRACMRCHRTQWQDMGWVLELPEDLGDEAISSESFVLTRVAGGSVPADLHETWFWS